MVAKRAEDRSSSLQQDKDFLDEFDDFCGADDSTQGFGTARQRSVLKGMSLLQAVLLLAFAKAAMTGMTGTEDKRPVSAVRALTEDSFPAHIASHPEGALINFHSDGCSYCEALAPELEAAAKELQSKGGVTIASVNAAQAPEALKRYKVSKFPMLVWFRKGEWVREVPASSRTSAKILEFVEWSSQPPVIDFEKRSDLDDAVPQIRGVLKPGAPPVIVGFASSPDVRSALEMVGESFRGDTAFLVTNETRAGDPVLRALSSENGTDQEYRDVVESEKIQTWVKDVLAKTKLLRKR
jgi:thiol-disulfide isomerase/thioredoxin